MSDPEPPGDDDPPSEAPPETAERPSALTVKTPEASEPKKGSNPLPEPMKPADPARKNPARATADESGWSPSFRGAVRFFDGFISLFERLFVFLILGTLVLGVFYFVYRALFSSTLAEKKLAREYVEKHRRRLAVLLAPVVLRPALIFLERVEEAFGMKAPIREEPMGGGKNPSARGST